MDPEVPEIPRRRTGEKPPRRLRKGMYILPSLFTTGNMAAGFYAMVQVLHYAISGAHWHLDHADFAGAHRLGIYRGPSHARCNTSARRNSRQCPPTPPRPKALDFFDTKKQL